MPEDADEPYVWEDAPPEEPAAVSRRSLIVGAGALAATATAGGLLATHSWGPVPLAPPPTSTPSATVTPSRRLVERADLDRLGDTGIPRIPWLSGSAYQPPSGPRRLLPVAEPDWAIRYQDTLYVGKRVHGTFLVGELDARSSRREEWRTRWRTRTIPVLSGDGQAMASVHGTGRDATLVVDAPVGRQRRRVPARAQPVGIFGFLTPTVVFEVADDGGVWTAGLGRPTRRIPRMRTATSVDAVHSRIAATDATGVGVLSLANREVLWHVDGSRPLSFSPDGTMVVLVTDLAGRRQLDVVAAGTGVPVVQLGSVGPRDQLFLTGLLWEDSAHLLATALWHGNQGILRLGIDGTITSALGWTAEPPSLIRFAEPGAARYVEPGPPVTGSD